MSVKKERGNDMYVCMYVTYTDSRGTPAGPRLESLVGLLIRFCDLQLLHVFIIFASPKYQSNKFNLFYLQ